MGDSWEDSAAPPPGKPTSLLQKGQGKSGLNPNANTFSFSPGAASFVPSGPSQAPKPPPGFSMPTYPPPPGGSVTSDSTPAAQSAAESNYRSETTAQAASAGPTTSIEASSPARPSEAAVDATPSSTSGKHTQMTFHHLLLIRISGKSSSAVSQQVVLGSTEDLALKEKFQIPCSVFKNLKLKCSQSASVVRALAAGWLSCCH